MILFIENPKVNNNNNNKKQLELINEFNKVAGFTYNSNQLYFYIVTTKSLKNNKNLQQKNTLE